MGNLFATVGLLLVGAIGGAAAMAFIGHRHGYRKPREHERRIFSALSALENLVRDLRR